jgi:drug/metabolite transporter (DMT)-like permease
VRWAAAGIALTGAAILMRPGSGVIETGALLALGAALCLGAELIFIKRLSGREGPWQILLMNNAIGLSIATLAVIWVWVAPTPAQWGFFVLLSLIANGGHYLIIRAYDHAEASLLAPLAYTEMVMATIAGWYFFGEFPDIWTFVGVGILIASAIYISWRERVRNVEPIRDFEQP